MNDHDKKLFEQIKRHRYLMNKYTLTGVLPPEEKKELKDLDAILMPLDRMGFLIKLVEHLSI